MVTIYKLEKSNNLGTGKFLVKLRGLSLDDKPTTINGGTVENGSTFIEIDTGDEYMYDLENTTWYKIASGSGGSEPMEKFDYVIPEISIYSEDETITDTDTIAVLDEIATNATNDLNICLHLYTDEDGKHHVINILDYDRDGWLYGLVNVGFWVQISITYYHDEWHCTSSELVS